MKGAKKKRRAGAKSALTRSAAYTDAPVRGEWPLVERRKHDRRQQDRRKLKTVSAGFFADLHDRCTAREHEILRLVLQGFTNKEIAHRLDVVEDTVKKHLQHIYRKCGVHRRALLILEQVERLRRS